MPVPASRSPQSFSHTALAYLISLCMVHAHMLLADILLTKNAQLYQLIRSGYQSRTFTNVKPHAADKRRRACSPFKGKVLQTMLALRASRLTGTAAP